MTLESIEENRERIASLGAKYPWLREIEAKVAQLEINYKFLESVYDTMVADRNANWMKLPVDADGEPWHCNEKAIAPDGTEFPVYSFGCDGGGRWFVYSRDLSLSYLAAECRHHRKPTVEDVLCEFASDVSCTGDGIKRTFKPDEPAIVQLADKLREAVRGE